MIEARTPAPRKFRRRLTLAFVLVASISAGVLAVTSFVLVKKDRFDSLTNRSIDKARLAATIAEGRLSEPPTVTEMEELLATLRRRAGMHAIAIAGETTVTSSPEYEHADIPSDVLDAPVNDGLQMVSAEVNGRGYLVMHDVETAGPILYLFTTENVAVQMNQLATLLVRIWVAVVVVAALIGHLVARRTLKPIASAGEAASALAEGLLDTRLPIETSDEFGTWATSFNRMAAALQDKIEELEEAADRERRFTSDVAHELRTPLSALVTSVGMLDASQNEMGPEARWAADRLSREVNRLRRLIEELLEISRLDAGQEPLRLEEVDLRQAMSKLIRHHRWEEQVEASIEETSVTTDVRRLDRVVVNLIANAIEHGGGKAHLSARVDGDDVVIEVHDSGPGIAETEIPKIFDRFYKSDPSRPGGSGLGLAIALENARLLGGGLSASSNSSGALLALRFPRTR